MIIVRDRFSFRQGGWLSGAPDEPQFHGRSRRPGPSACAEPPIRFHGLAMRRLELTCAVRGPSLFHGKSPGSSSGLTEQIGFILFRKVSAHKQLHLGWGDLSLNDGCQSRQDSQPLDLWMYHMHPKKGLTPVVGCGSRPPFRAMASSCRATPCASACVRAEKWLRKRVHVRKHCGGASQSGCRMVPGTFRAGKRFGVARRDKQLR